MGIEAVSRAGNDLHGRASLPWWVHLAAILTICLAAGIRYRPLVTSSAARTDERVYLAAFRAVGEGESPYAALDAQGLDFYYPPGFAALGAAALRAWDWRTVVIGLRSVNLLGLACCLWCSFLFVRLPWRWCLAAAVLYVVLVSSALHHGFRSGNLSFAVVGASLLALAVWRRQPLLAGLLLGLGTVTKPVAPAGLATLGAHRPIQGGRRHLLAAGVGIAFAGVLTIASPFLADYLRLDGDPGAWPLARSVSLYRWVHLLGLPLPPVALVAMVALAAAWLARRGPVTPRRLYVLSTVAMTLATPALWSHTMLLTLPVQVLAVVKAAQRLRAGDLPAARRRYELVLVLLGVAALTFVDGIGGGVEASATPIQLVTLAVPVWAPLGLGLYAWRNDVP